MNTIKIFLASSLDEFAQERLELEAYVNRLNKVYVPQYSIFLELVMCEDLSKAMDVGRKQESYNQEIRNSQYFYVLFGQYAGKYTLEEFDVARESQQSVGAPKVYTYFRVLPTGVEPEQSVTDFMERLDKELGHYYSVFSYLDSVKLDMLIELTADLPDKGGITFENGWAKFGDSETVSLENIPAYAGNEELTRLRAELEKLNERYAQLCSRATANKIDSERYVELGAISKQRKSVSERIHAIEAGMLGMYRQISNAKQGDRPITWREKRASELLEIGDYQGALEILRDAQRDRDLAFEQEKVDTSRERMRGYIAENRLRIAALEASGLTPEHVAEIDACYRECIELAEEYRLDLEVMFGYAVFLERRNRFVEAIEVGERLEAWYELDNDVSDVDRANLLNTLGLCYWGRNDFERAEDRLKESVELRRRLAGTAPAQIASLAGACMNLSLVLTDLHRYSEAEPLELEALEIRKRLIQDGKPSSLGSYGDDCNNFGNLLRDLNRYDEAERWHLLALSLFKRLVKEDGDAWNVGVAKSAQNLAAALMKQRRFDEAETYARLAWRIKVPLAQVDFNLWGSLAINTAVLLADCLARRSKLQGALGLYRVAIKWCRRLVAIDEKTWRSQLAITLGAASSTMIDLDRYEEAERYKRESHSIFRELAAESQEAWSPDLAASCNDMAVLLVARREPAAAEPFYQEALDTYRRLVEIHREAWLPYLSGTLNNLGNLLADLCRLDEAESALRESLAIRRKLVEDGGESWISAVAQSCGNLAKVLQKRNRDDEAEHLAREKLVLLRPLYHKDSIAWGKAYALANTTLANIVRDKDSEEAGGLYREALSAFQALEDKASGMWTSCVAMAQFNLALHFYNNGQLDDAEKLMIEASLGYGGLAKENRRVWLPDYEDCLQILVQINNDAGRYKDALGWCKPLLSLTSVGDGADAEKHERAQHWKERIDRKLGNA